MEPNKSMPFGDIDILTLFMTRPLEYFLMTTIFLAISYILTQYSRSNLNDYPVVNASRKGLLSGRIGTRRAFTHDALNILREGRTKYPDRAFRIEADFGELLVLPPSLADEIRNEPKLSFGAATAEDFHGDIPGFQPFAQGSQDDEILQTVARKQLTKSLSKITEPLSEETASALAINFGDTTELRDILLYPAVLDTVARLSSRVFLGDRLCRDDIWLRMTKSYTTTAFQAAQRLRVYPRHLRKLVHWLQPECRQLRAQLAEARGIVAAVIEERRQARKTAAEAGQPVPEYNDAIDWADQEAARKRSTRYDPAVFQLILSVAAIHTTTDLTCQVILDLARHLEFIQPLREEISSVLGAEGWKKTALYNLKLLDSCIKESQRVKPINASELSPQANFNAPFLSSLT
ncbi:hypothetical protein SLS63_002717 [Diaporthe eres]|uniref:Cytochrome P450 n=1 Tax=Diaporthe eres TaxID=83184 RepID=A0ABR1PIU1_DIAER